MYHAASEDELLSDELDGAFNLARSQYIQRRDGMCLFHLTSGIVSRRAVLR